MKLLVILFVMIGALITQENQGARTVYVTLVQPSGETFTQEEQAHALTSVHNAFLFWKIEYNLVDVSLMQPTLDPYDTVLWDWCNCHFLETSTELHVFIIDNSNSKKPLFGRMGAYAQDYLGIVVSLLHSGPEPLPARLAHEYGHVYYNLPDLYLNGADCNDIMCNPTWAYQNNFIGCTSMQTIGKPCTRVALPLVIR